LFIDHSWKAIQLGSPQFELFQLLNRKIKSSDGLQSSAQVMGFGLLGSLPIIKPWKKGVIRLGCDKYPRQYDSCFIPLLHPYKWTLDHD
jgi:hypothetical protein